MKSISSRQNIWFKRFREAVTEHRDEIVLEGPKMVHDAVAAGWQPIAVATTLDTDVGFELETYRIEFTDALIGSISDTRSTQHLLGLFERPRWSVEAIRQKRDAIIVALDRIQDPGNVGTIVRLGAAFDVAGVIVLPGTADPLAPKSIRATAGAILDVPIVSMSIDDLLELDLPLFAADAHGREIDPPSRSAILVFGNEGAGVEPAILGRATPIAIPMSSRVESLNVAASAAILLSRSYIRRS